MSRLCRSLALFFLFPAIAVCSDTAKAPKREWKFAVSGDSRNCGDVVMPTIAKSVHEKNADFYWHLGDLRYLYNIDEDMAAASHKAVADGKARFTLSIPDYEKFVWQDFIDNQVRPFGQTRFYLGIGNHEVVPPKTRYDFVAQFGEWLSWEDLRQSRLRDDPNDHALRSYYHWIHDGIDFINLDNATADQFDDAQMKWVTSVLSKDAADHSVRAVIVGMHEALPESWSRGHSMSEIENGRGQTSGIDVYKKLLEVQKAKPVYVFASHSHFYMANIYDTPYWHANGGVLPGWIVGTAGAQRYPLPDGVAQSKTAQQDVYGYLLVTIHPGAKDIISTEFVPVHVNDVPADVRVRYPARFPEWCWENNSITHPQTFAPW